MKTKSKKSSLLKHLAGLMPDMATRKKFAIVLLAMLTFYQVTALGAMAAGSVGGDISQAFSEIGGKLQTIATSATSIVSGLAILGILIAGVMILSGKPDAVKMGILVLIGAVIAKYSSTIGGWIVNGSATMGP